MPSLFVRLSSRSRTPTIRPGNYLRTTSCHIRSSSSIPDAIGSSSYQSAEQESVPRRRSSEAWINPDSLKETLDKHREANRKRRAVDGVPVENVQHKSGREDIQRLLRSAEQTKVHPAIKHLALRRPRTASSVEQYAGKSRELTWEWKVSTTLPRGLEIPWICELEKEPTTQFNVPAVQRLNDEILMCDRYLSPTPAELQAARKAYAEICSTISAATNDRDIKFELIGSRASSLDCPLSDLDINLKTSRWQVLDDQQRLVILKRLNKNLRFPKSDATRRDDISLQLFLSKSVVPIISCVHLPSALTFQVQFSRSCYESLELTKAFVAEYPTLRSLYLVLKQMLVMRGLTFGGQGGLTSYPLLNMIVASLKIGNAAKNESAIGAQLLDFLDFFSDISFTLTAIRYHPPSTFGDDLGLDLEYSGKAIRDRTIDPMTTQPVLKTIRNRRRDGNHLMSFQDPADSTNDLGNSTYLIKHVQETFIEARQQIRQAMKTWDEKYSRKSNMKTHGEPILAWCLQGDYSQHEVSRQMLRKYGAEVQSAS